jgi:hypothetical protein
LRYLKKLLRPLLGFAFRISVGGYIFGFNVAPGPPTRRPLPGKPPGKGGNLEGPEKPPTQEGGVWGWVKVDG